MDEKILYAIGFVLIILGGFSLAIFDFEMLGYILIILGVIAAGLSKILR